VPIFEGSTIGNHLLAGLAPEAFAAILPHLRRVDLPLRATLHVPYKPIKAVFFPERGNVSVQVMLENGDAIEIGMVGSEGMVGIPAVLGADGGPVEALVQAKGVALRLDADAFRRALDDNPALRHRMLCYVTAFSVQVAVTAACNAQHLVEQRLARWLLMAHDRVAGDEFPMTHEFLSTMLGVRRAGVTVAAGALQKAGHISYKQGRIRIADRPGLEDAACECHAVVRREFDRLLGPIVRT